MPSILVSTAMGGNFLVAATITHIAVPLGFALAFWWPWWVRWAAAGVLVVNTVVLLATYIVPWLLSSP